MAHIAFLIMYGPEVRAFVHSGLVSKIGTKHRVSIVTTVPNSAVYRDIRDVAVIKAPTSLEHKWLQKLRYYSRRAHEKWMFHKTRQRRWRHSQTTANQNEEEQSRVKELYWRLISFILRGVEAISGQVGGTHAEWRDLIKAHEIDILVTASYSSMRIIPAIQTAANLGVPTVAILNSWKDIYVTPYVAVKPSIIGVWNDLAARDLLASNSWLPPQSVIKVTSLHYQNLLFSHEVHDRETLSSLTGLNPERPYICYTAASPTATENEEQIIELLLQDIQNGKIPHNPQLLLRMNPMEDGKRFAGLAERYPDDLVVQKPVWEWDRKIDWCSALSDDSKLWHSTIYHSIINVSIPSTVTIEFLALRKPVVNVCFDMTEGLPSNRSNKRFWDAPFYREIREGSLADPAFSYFELITNIAANITIDNPSNSPNMEFDTQQPVSVIIRLLDDLANRG